MESLSTNLKKKATEQHYRAEVMIAGEQLRLRLHDGKLIKDRRYHLRTYPNCFVAKELTDWLIDHKEAPDRETGIRLMQKLMDHYIIHHVCDEHSDYKDAKLLYRFRKDDGTFPLSKDVKVFLRGQSLYEKLLNVEGSILKVREENAVKYQRTFLGCELIDWLLQEGEAENRKEAVELGRALLEHGIIQHVSNRHHFFDSDILYQFWINFRRRRRLTELLNENSSRALSESPDSPFCLRKLNPDPGNTSFLSVQPNKEIKVAVRRSSITSLAGNSNPYFSTTPALLFPPVAECNPKSDCGGCCGLGVCGPRRKTLPHPGSGSWRTCCCCRDEGLPVCFLSQWDVWFAPGLSDHQQPHHDRATNSGHGSHGSH
ncbi:DEP domain-containing mTOR-interacting protein isoform X2 [Calypte anna]|uniref:DEP domain-containing mTOR-interacting protein isoform X2 n=1 Tax=Calypte anna TaxID=9244 RepID=UPI0011C3CE7B|nr:DEP domain-containing mTOR-interacting protein isoform X2 [Calypte anna]